MAKSTDPERPRRGDHPGRDDGNGRLSGMKAARLAREQLQELTGQSAEAVSGLSHHDEGWTVLLEVVELERVPRSTDIMASYRVDLDEDGELASYERVGRYYRNAAGGNG